MVYLLLRDAARRCLGWWAVLEHEHLQDTQAAVNGLLQGALPPKCHRLF